MIGRKSEKKQVEEVEAPKGFDDFDLRLGDLLRGERATLGKSLLDVQRELRIKASYIAAIENADPTVFDTPGFIAGYVRSYSRYLGLDPEETFALFCAESGFATAHGMADEASTIKMAAESAAVKPSVRDPLFESKAPFIPARESILARIEPRAVGSTFVLVALIAGIGYGGMSVLNEIQRVQVSPVEQTPSVLSELDPLDGAGTAGPQTQASPEIASAGAGVFTPPTSEAFDRLYRPEALDVPVLVARDAPISSLDPDSLGVFASRPSDNLPAVQDADLAMVALENGLAVTNSAAGPSDVVLVAARPAWVEIKDDSGSVLLSRVLNAGETFDVPADASGVAATIGESGAVYFAVAGTVFGPVGARGAVTSDLTLEADLLTALYSPVQAGSDADLNTVLADLSLTSTTGPTVASATMPQVLQGDKPGVMVIATSDSWVEVTSPSGTKLLAAVMKKGDTYLVPQTDQAPTIFSGNAGAIYFAVNGETYGPFGESGQFGRDLALAEADITAQMPAALPAQHQDLATVVAELNASGN